MKKDPPLPPKERIGIIEPHAMTSLGLVTHIKESGHWEVAWVCGSAEAAQNLVSTDTPDGIVTAIGLPGKDGLELIKHLMPMYPHLRILVHSSHSEEFYAERCLHAGALGYLPKNGSLELLKKALERVMHGDLFITQRIARASLCNFSLKKARNGDDHHLHSLTDRELEIMILMAQGLSVQQTASKLQISPRTVQVHRNNIRLKIGLETATELHAYAVKFYSEDAENHLGA